MIVKTEATEGSEKGMSLGLGCQVMLREGLFRVVGMVGYNPQLGKRIQKPGLFLITVICRFSSRAES